MSFSHSGNLRRQNEIFINFEIGSTNKQATVLQTFTGMRFIATEVQFKPKIKFTHSSGLLGFRKSELDKGGGINSNGFVEIFGNLSSSSRALAVKKC